MNKRKRPTSARMRQIHSPLRNAAPSGGGGPGLLWIYGIHAVLAALANPARRCHRLVATSSDVDSLTDHPTFRDRNLSVEIEEKREIEQKLPPGAVHQGVALQVDPLEEPGLEAAVPDSDESAVVLVLDQVTDPRNVGAALRAAAAFGARAVVMQQRHAPPETGALAKAASGALEVVPIIRVTNLARALTELQAAGFWCIGLDGKGQQTLAETDLSGRIALVLGSEGSGLRRLTMEHCDHVARIPITSRVESLNLATAAAVGLYEWSRRKT